MSWWRCSVDSIFNSWSRCQFWWGESCWSEVGPDSGDEFHRCCRDMSAATLCVQAVSDVLLAVENIWVKTLQYHTFRCYDFSTTILLIHFTNWQCWSMSILCETIIASDMQFMPCNFSIHWTGHFFHLLHMLSLQNKFFSPFEGFKL